MSPYRSFSVLGMVPGVIVTISVAASVQYTSLILWRFCLKHPEIRDVCDIGQALFGGSKVAYNVTAVFFLLNNTFIQGIPTSSYGQRQETSNHTVSCYAGCPAGSASRGRMQKGRQLEKLDAFKWAAVLVLFG